MKLYYNGCDYKMKIQKNEPWFWIVNYLAFLLGISIGMIVIKNNEKSHIIFFSILIIALILILIKRYDISDNFIVSKIIVICYNLPTILISAVPGIYLSIYSPDGIIRGLDIISWFFGIIFILQPFLITAINFIFIKEKTIKKYILFSFSYYIVYIIFGQLIVDWISSSRID